MNYIAAFAETYKKISEKNWYKTAESFTLLAVLVSAITALNHNFLSPMNMETLLGDIGPMLLMALGCSPIIIMGSTDLSIGAMASVSSVIFCRFAGVLGWKVYLLVLSIGAFSGFAIGYLNAKAKVPSFISSLAFMSIWSSLALVMTNGKGSLSLNKPCWYLVNWARGTITSWFPSIMLPAVILFFVCQYLVKYTAIGKQIYSIGGNERASYISGIPVAATKIIAFTFAGTLYSFAGILYTGKLLSGSPDLGNDFTLLTIAAVALGGTSLSGGIGTMYGALLGTCIASVITNGMTIIGIGSWWQRVVFGSIIIIAAFLTSDRRQTKLIAIK